MKFSKVPKDKVPYLIGTFAVGLRAPSVRQTRQTVLQFRMRIANVLYQLSSRPIVSPLLTSKL